MTTATAPIRSREEAQSRILQRIDALGLNANLLELETQGFTILPGVLSPETVERAKAAILRKVEQRTGARIDPATATEADFKGMQYIPYLLHADPVFEDILLEPGPLALVTWLLGESALLSSMGCHFRGPGGTPLMVHSDNGNGMPTPFSTISMVANVNYALTPYSREAGALAMFPGSHRLLRQPTAAENFKPEGAVWRDPPAALTLTIQPGDAVIWHGNTWHGGHIRELPGVRMNLSAYFNRQHIQTQERRGEPADAALVARRGNDPQLAVLLGAKQPYGWTDDGPDYALMARNPRGQFD